MLLPRLNKLLLLFGTSLTASGTAAAAASC
jgi:hypothetical protein